MSRAGKLVVVLAVLCGVVAYMAPKMSPDERASAEAERQQEAETDRSRKEMNEQRQKEYVAIAAAKKAVLERLNDPDSAKFGKIVVKESGVVCGYVNAKNTFGGYTGEKEFVSLGTKEATLLASDDGAEKMWNERCAAK